MYEKYVLSAVLVILMVYLYYRDKQVEPKPESAKAEHMCCNGRSSCCRCPCHKRMYYY